MTPALPERPLLQALILYNCQRSPLQRGAGSQIELAVVKLRNSPQQQAVLTAKFFARWCLKKIPPPLGLVGKSRTNGTR
jgi:hypothetical protein